jgi:hypothetical protein
MTTTAPNSFWQRAHAEREQALNQAENWQPEEPGDTLLGLVVAIGEGHGDWGPYPTVTVRTEDGTDHLWRAFGMVAQGQMEEKNPQRGNGIAIAYLGQRTSKSSGKEYAAWNIRVFDGGDEAQQILGDDTSGHQETLEEPKPKAARGKGKSAASAQNDDDIPF